MPILRAALVLAVALGAVAPVRAQTGEGIAATVNDEPITTYEVRQRAALLLAFSETTPSLEVAQIAQEQALRTLIEERLQMQEAAKFELVVSDEQVDEAMQNLAQQSGSDLDSDMAALAAAGVPADTLRNQIRSEIAWSNLVAGRYQDRVRISSDTVNQAMEELVRSLQEPQYRVAEIMIPIENVADEAASRTRAEGVLEQLRQGGNFPELARQNSAALTAQRGGDTGFQTVNQFPPEVAQILPSMPENGVAGPIRAAGAYYIIALIQKRDATSAEQLTLKAIVLPVAEGASEADRQATRARLADAARGASSCDAANTIAEAVDGAFVSDLGTLSAASLQPQVREALASLQPGQATDAILSQLGAQVFILCNREIGGPGVPSRQEIAARMEDQRRSMLSRRYLRDLRREAVIEIRGEQQTP